MPIVRALEDESGWSFGKAMQSNMREARASGECDHLHITGQLGLQSLEAAYSVTEISLCRRSLKQRRNYLSILMIVMSRLGHPVEIWRLTMEQYSQLLGSFACIHGVA